MNHVHFDAGKVTEALQDLARKIFDTAMAAARDDHQRAFAQAQFDSIAADMVIQSQFIAMKNDGRSAVFVGRIVGALIGRNIVNIVQNVDDPATCLAEIDQTVRRMIAKFYENDTCHVLVHGERGGRA